MRSSDDGFVAMMDAMIFIVVIVMAASVTAGIAIQSVQDETDTSEFLDSLLLSKVRLSDFSQGDDSIVRLSDLMALSAVGGNEKMMSYLEDALLSFSRGRPCHMLVEYENDGTSGRIELGNNIASPSMESVRETAVSTGGTLRVTVSIGSNRSRALSGVDHQHHHNHKGDGGADGA